MCLWFLWAHPFAISCPLCIGINYARSLWVLRPLLSSRHDILLDCYCVLFSSQQRGHRLALQTLRIWPTDILEKLIQTVKWRFCMTTGLRSWSWWRPAHSLSSCGQQNWFLDSSVGIYMNQENSHFWDFNKSWWIFWTIVPACRLLIYYVPDCWYIMCFLKQKP